MLEMAPLDDNIKTNETNEESDHCIIAIINHHNYVDIVKMDDIGNIIVNMDDIRNIIVKMDDSTTNIQQFVYMHLICMKRTI